MDDEYERERALILGQQVREQEELVRLQQENRYLKTENLVWRMMVACIRDVACNYAPIISHARELAWVYRLMRDEDAMSQEVYKRIAGDKRKAKLAAARAKLAAARDDG